MSSSSSSSTTTSTQISLRPRNNSFSTGSSSESRPRGPYDYNGKPSSQYILTSSRSTGASSKPSLYNENGERKQVRHIISTMDRSGYQSRSHSQSQSQSQTRTAARSASTSDATPRASSGSKSRFPVKIPTKSQPGSEQDLTRAGPKYRSSAVTSTKDLRAVAAKHTNRGPVSTQEQGLVQHQHQQQQEQRQQQPPPLPPQPQDIPQHLKPRLTVEVPRARASSISGPIPQPSLKEAKSLPHLHKSATKTTHKSWETTVLPIVKNILRPRASREKLNTSISHNNSSTHSLPVTPGSPPRPKERTERRKSNDAEPSPKNKTQPKKPVPETPSSMYSSTVSNSHYEKAARVLGVSPSQLEIERSKVNGSSFYSDESDFSDTEVSDADRNSSRESRASSHTSHNSSRSRTGSWEKLDDQNFTSLPQLPKSRSAEAINVDRHITVSAGSSTSSSSKMRSHSLPTPRPRSKSLSATADRSMKMPSTKLRYHNSHPRYRGESRSLPQTLLSSITENSNSPDTVRDLLREAPNTPPSVPEKSERRPMPKHKKHSDAIMKAVETALANIKPLNKMNGSSENVSNIHPAERTTMRLLSLAMQSADGVHNASGFSITAGDAENVITRILEQIDSFKDLHTASMINQAFHTVFKRNELKFVKKVLRNRSPAAYELRMTMPAETVKVLGGVEEALSPTKYLHMHLRDQSCITVLKSMISGQCSSYVRADTLAGLEDPSDPRSKNIDDALWRIWTFCSIFGCGKGGEDDIVGQMDWLNGGVLAHQSNGFCASGSAEAFQTSKVLIDASETFGMGNPGGLTAEQLYDMTEMWNCLRALMNGLLGSSRIEQARRHGVFAKLDIEEGDFSKQEDMLEEWMYYLSTLGPQVILALAGPALSKDDSVFTTAQQMGWTAWTLPEHGNNSRCNFLKESVTRVYQQRMTSVMADAGHTYEEAHRLREQRRQRGAELAAELRELRDQAEARLSRLLPPNFDIQKHFHQHQQGQHQMQQPVAAVAAA